MESRDVVDESDAAKRLYASTGDTPGKPERKTRRLSRKNRNATSSRALFQSSGTPPKVLFDITK